MKQSAKKHFAYSRSSPLLFGCISTRNCVKAMWILVQTQTAQISIHCLAIGPQVQRFLMMTTSSSHVLNHARFRNAATQVRTDITAENDKKLLAWVPVNNPHSTPCDGVFDSEVFSMWSYVTHWGDWTAPLGRIPGAFLDVAHKNGVPVSGVASIPWGGISHEYSSMLAGLAKVRCG